MVHGAQKRRTGSQKHLRLHRKNIRHPGDTKPPTMTTRARERQFGDFGWLAVAASAIAYELLATLIGEELLSMAAIRYRSCHPWLTRLVVAVIAGHLGGLTPPCLDMLSDRGPIHRWLAACWPRPTPPWWCSRVGQIRTTRDAHPEST
jgi:hypothetical protein